MTVTDDKLTALRSLDSWFDAHFEQMLADLRWLVELETPSGAKTEIDNVQKQLAAKFREAGAETEIIAGPDGNHLLARYGSVKTDQIFIVGHVDTVWPIGTLARKPFKIENGIAFGPGVYDMKAGIIMLLYVLKAFKEIGLRPNRPLTMLITADEEVGSTTSRANIEEEAKKAAYALVLEPPLENGAVKTSRKGVGRYTLKVKGRASHAGVEPEKGVNAIVEMAHQTLAINALNNYAVGTTLNVGVLSGGTRSNVVPAEAEAEIDLRVSTLSEADRINTAMNSLMPVLPEAQLLLEGGLNRPPFERTEQVVELYQKAAAVAAALNWPEKLEEGGTGGGSDGNFTAALGIATLDGLGCLGKGAHAEHEQIIVAALPKRAHLLAGLLATL